MDRPSRKRVLDAIYRDSHGVGPRKFLDAAQLSTGVMVVQYQTVRDSPVGAHVQRRLVVMLPDGRITHSIITDSWFEDQKEGGTT